MANSLFDAGREGFLDGTIDFDTAVIKTHLVKGYTFNAAHKWVSDITTAGGTFPASGSPSPALSSKTVAGGVADAADITFTAPTANATNHYLLLYQASAVTGGADVAATAQRVICYIDTGTNIPIIPNGADVAVAWDNGPNKIFKL